MPNSQIKIAAVQMVSTPEPEENFATARRLVGQAAADGAQLVLLPEYWPIMGLRDTDKVAHAETLGAGPIQSLMAELAQQHAANPGARAPHKFLARELTELIHGKTAADDALRASEILFGGKLDGIAESTFNEILGEVPTKEIAKARLEGAGLPLVELLVQAGLCPSKGQARKDVEGGGVNINNVREAGATRAVTTNDLLFGKHLLLRKGKKNYVVVSAK